MSVVTPLITPKECFETLMNLYEKKDPIQKMDLKNKLRNLNMEKNETIASFFTSEISSCKHRYGDR